MNEILWVLHNERHCSGWHCDLVRDFWLWIMTVGSKLNGYGYESNGGLHCEFYHNDGKKMQLLTVSIHTITTKTGILKTCNSTGFHIWVTCFSSHKTTCQFIANIDTLIFWYYTWQTEYLVSQQKQHLPGLQ
jgi:hypothetical protein